MSGQPEAITREELRAAIDRLGWYVDRNATHPADRIIRDVERHRGPAYEPGGVYRDAHGDVFKYCNDLAGDTPWLGFTGELYAHSHVSQPLRRLVPEGSTAMLLATKLNAIRDLCDGSELLSARQALAIIDGEGTCPGGC